MEIEFFGANCFRISDKKASLVIDDNLEELGGKTVTKAGDIALFTSAHGPAPKDAKLTIDRAGEYEVSNASAIGVSARSQTDEPDSESDVIFKLIISDIRVAVVGHVFPELSDAQLEAIGTIDVLLIPVGGNGYTLDGASALKLIKKIEPKIVIPSHYADKKLKYPVEQEDLETAIKSLAMEPKEHLAKLKLKPSDLPFDGTQLIILERS